MRIRYTDNAIERARCRLNKLRAKRDSVALWHRKFAWLPLKITIPEDSTEDYSTAVLFEWVMQKAHIRDYQYRSIRKFIWTRHPEKEYFKKKLDGTLEKEERFTDKFADDETTFRSSGNAGVSTPMPTKLAGGPARLGGPSAKGSK